MKRQPEQRDKTKEGIKTIKYVQGTNKTKEE